MHAHLGPPTTFNQVVPNRRTFEATVAIRVAGLASYGSLVRPSPEFVVRNATVVVQSQAPFTQRADYPAHVESAIEGALRAWGGDWERLKRRTITFEGEQRVFCGSHQGELGCFDGESTRPQPGPRLHLLCACAGWASAR